MTMRPTPEIDPASQADTKEDLLVCFCMKICQKTLISAISSGADNLERLMLASRAGTGCGTCRVDLIHLIDKHGRNDHDD